MNNIWILLLVIGGKIYDSESSADLAIYFDVGGIAGKL